MGGWCVCKCYVCMCVYKWCVLWGCMCIMNACVFACMSIVDACMCMCVRIILWMCEGIYPARFLSTPSTHIGNPQMKAPLGHISRDVIIKGSTSHRFLYGMQHMSAFHFTLITHRG